MNGLKLIFLHSVSNEHASEETFKHAFLLRLLLHEVILEGTKSTQLNDD